MQLHHLERKGWSQGELEHAKRVLDHAEAAKHPHVRTLEQLHAVLLVLTLSLASAGAVLLLSPVLIFNRAIVSVPAMLLLGICVGLLYSHNESHHELGLVGLCALSFIGILIVTPLFGIAPIPLALAYTCGIMGAYLERRHHG